MENNIYKKLQAMRLELANTEIKKTGTSKDKNGKIMYYYFELGDFLPKVTELLNTNNITSLFEMNLDRVKLTLIDSETKETIVFRVPHADATLYNADKMKCRGAEITYMRRYMYLIAFDIVENDIIDSQDSTQKVVFEISDKEKQEIMEIEDPKALAEHCKSLMKTKGKSYERSILEAFNAQKYILKELLVKVKNE